MQVLAVSTHELGMHVSAHPQGLRGHTGALKESPEVVPHGSDVGIEHAIQPRLMLWREWDRALEGLRPTTP